jgi:hypothetical protein
VRYLEFLRGVHAALAPTTYLEIGVRRGNSLALSRSSSIGIDPAYDLKPQHTRLATESALFRETSDDYFAREDPLEPFGDRPISLAFIDGMHLVEFALRDFINVERHAHWTSVVVFDDILPRSPLEAARERATRAWTGDVYKIVGVLRRHRPDLICLRVGAQPTGLLLVLALDPTNRVLSDRYDEIVSEAIVPDPQRIPDDIVERRGVLDPQAVLSGSFWSVVRSARESGETPEAGVRRLRRAIRRDFQASPLWSLRRLLPLPA